jgi:hypothetical protein
MTTGQFASEAVDFALRIGSLNAATTIVDETIRLTRLFGVETAIFGTLPNHQQSPTHGLLAQREPAPGFPNT